MYISTAENESQNCRQHRKWAGKPKFPYFDKFREAAKKRYFFSGPATNRGGGVKGLATKNKDRFLKLYKNYSGKIFVITNLEGGKALVAGRLK